MREKQLDDIYNASIYKNYFFIDLIEKKQLDDIYYVVVEALHMLLPNETNKKGVQRRVFRRHSFRFAQSLGKTLAAISFRFALRNWEREMAFAGGRVLASPICFSGGMQVACCGGLVFEKNCRTPASRTTRR